MMRAKRRTTPEAGFTLAELLVASLLLSIVMAAVYTAFSSSVRLWRLGEANIQTYQDARTSLTIMTREVQNIVPGAAHLMEGTNDTLEFFAVAPPMDVDEDSEPRVLCIQYRTKKNPDPDVEGMILVREERIVKSPLPSAPPGEGEIESTIIKMGNEKDFDLAAGVKNFEIRYMWRASEESPDGIPTEGPPEPVEFTVLDEHPKGAGIPQGIRIELILLDPNEESGETTFTTCAVFRGATTELDREFLDMEEGAFQ